MASAGYLASVYVTGVSTGLTGGAGEPTTDVSGGAKTSWQITDAAKQIVDPGTAIVIFDNNTGAAYAHAFTMDYLSGTVTLAVAAGAAGIKIQGNYLPKRQILNAYSMDVSLSRNLADTSLFGAEFVKRTPTIGDISGSMACYDAATTYTDVKLSSVTLAGTPKVVDMQWGGANYVRFFALFESTEISATPDGVQELTASFQMAAQTAVTGGTPVEYSIV
jgi:hypothetical protein